MRNLFFALTIILCGCDSRIDSTTPGWAIAIHGGAGNFGTEHIDSELEALYSESLNKALSAGEELLRQGATAVETVEAVIRILEDDSLFNAGRGAVYTSQGTHELDASIADGSSRNCGAITGIQGYRHPISVARSVMDSSDHVFFCGHGAAEFAQQQNHEEASPDWFHTSKAYDRYKRAAVSSGDTPAPEDKKGTVGCAVLDSHGHLAAGTSTGGMTYKKHGRIGDSPVIGAGTWADDRTCAVSATGWGEYFIRTGVTQDVHSRMLYQNATLTEACRGAIFDEMGALGGDGGVIAVSATGEISLVCNTRGMFRAWAKPGARAVAMFSEKSEGTIESH
jgi:isoaspartyl peptidase/L-asparaginase-like protein (Ntn-hydrolase superfamily)